MKTYPKVLAIALMSLGLLSVPASMLAASNETENKQFIGTAPGAITPFTTISSDEWNKKPWPSYKMGNTIVIVHPDSNISLPYLDPIIGTSNGNLGVLSASTRGDIFHFGLSTAILGSTGQKIDNSIYGNYNGNTGNLYVLGGTVTGGLIDALGKLENVQGKRFAINGGATVEPGALKNLPKMAAVSLDAQATANLNQDDIKGLQAAASVEAPAATLSRVISAHQEAGTGELRAYFATDDIRSLIGQIKESKNTILTGQNNEVNHNELIKNSMPFITDGKTITIGSKNMSIKTLASAQVFTNTIFNGRNSFIEWDQDGRARVNLDAVTHGSTFLKEAGLNANDIANVRIGVLTAQLQAGNPTYVTFWTSRDEDDRVNELTKNAMRTIIPGLSKNTKVGVVFERSFAYTGDLGKDADYITDIAETVDSRFGSATFSTAFYPANTRLQIADEAKIGLTEAPFWQQGYYTVGDYTKVDASTLKSSPDVIKALTKEAVFTNINKAAPEITEQILAAANNQVTGMKSGVAVAPIRPTTAYDPAGNRLHVDPAVFAKGPNQ